MIYGTTTTIDRTENSTTRAVTGLEWQQSHLLMWFLHSVLTKALCNYFDYWKILFTTGLGLEWNKLMRWRWTFTLHKSLGRQLMGLPCRTAIIHEDSCIVWGGTDNMTEMEMEDEGMIKISERNFYWVRIRIYCSINMISGFLQSDHGHWNDVKGMLVGGGGRRCAVIPIGLYWSSKWRFKMFRKLV